MPRRFAWPLRKDDVRTPRLLPPHPRDPCIPSLGEQLKRQGPHYDLTDGTWMTRTYREVQQPEQPGGCRSWRSGLRAHPDARPSAEFRVQEVVKNAAAVHPWNDAEKISFLLGCFGSVGSVDRQLIEIQDIDMSQAMSPIADPRTRAPVWVETRKWVYAWWQLFILGPLGPSYGISWSLSGHPVGSRRHQAPGTSNLGGPEVYVIILAQIAAADGFCQRLVRAGVGSAGVIKRWRHGGGIVSRCRSWRHSCCQSAAAAVRAAAATANACSDHKKAGPRVA